MMKTQVNLFSFRAYPWLAFSLSANQFDGNRDVSNLALSSNHLLFLGFIFPSEGEEGEKVFLKIFKRVTHVREKPLQQVMTVTRRNSYNNSNTCRGSEIK